MLFVLYKLIARFPCRWAVIQILMQVLDTSLAFLVDSVPEGNALLKQIEIHGRDLPVPLSDAEFLRCTDEKVECRLLFWKFE